MVDPTSDEAARMTTMQAVFTWAGFGTEDMTTDKTRAGSLALLLGIKPDAHPRVLGLMDETDAMAVVAKWKVAPKESEPTSEQLSAIFHLVSQNNVPYCDFSVFGPYGHLMIKKIKLSGYIIGRDGTLQNVELTGPTNINMWLQSWQVFSNACVMLDIIDLGVLNKYRDLMEKYHNRYGVAIWALLYQADVRCRLELFERIRRQIMAEQESLNKAHGGAPGHAPTVAGFDPKRPWNLVLQRAINNEEYIGVKKLLSLVYDGANES